MDNELNDIRYVIRLYHELSRHASALDNFELLIKKCSDLTLEDLTLLNAISKSIVDPLRNAIKTIKCHYISEKEDNEMEKAELLDVQYQSASADLTSQCKRILSIVNSIIPNANTPEIRAFCYTICGDFYRYLIEAESETDSEQAKKQAENFYETAMQIYVDEVPISSSKRLHAISNYAVFLFEHLSKKQQAIDLLTSTVKEIEGLPEAQRTHDWEGSSAYCAMKKNLSVWNSQ